MDAQLIDALAYWLCVTEIPVFHTVNPRLKAGNQLPILCIYSLILNNYAARGGGMQP